MAETTTIRVDKTTRDELKRIARANHWSVAETVTRGTRLLRQESIGLDLAAPLSDEEVAWLDARGQ